MKKGMGLFIQGVESLLFFSTVQFIQSAFQVKHNTKKTKHFFMQEHII